MSDCFIMKMFTEIIEQCQSKESSQRASEEVPHSEEKVSNTRRTGYEEEEADIRLLQIPRVGRTNRNIMK